MIMPLIFSSTVWHEQIKISTLSVLCEFPDEVDH